MYRSKARNSVSLNDDIAYITALPAQMRPVSAGMTSQIAFTGAALGCSLSSVIAPAAVKAIGDTMIQLSHSHRSITDRLRVENHHGRRAGLAVIDSRQQPALAFFELAFFHCAGRFRNTVSKTRVPRTDMTRIAIDKGNLVEQTTVTL